MFVAGANVFGPVIVYTGHTHCAGLVLRILATGRVFWRSLLLRTPHQQD